MGSIDCFPRSDRLFTWGVYILAAVMLCEVTAVVLVGDGLLVGLLALATFFIGGIVAGMYLGMVAMARDCCQEEEQ